MTSMTLKTLHSVTTLLCNMRKKLCFVFVCMHMRVDLCLFANFQPDHFQTAGYGPVVVYLKPCMSKKRAATVRREREGEREREREREREQKVATE